MCIIHYGDVIMSRKASLITSLTIVYSIVYSGADQRKHQSTASLAFVRGIHRGPQNGQQRGKCFHLMTSSCIAMCHVKSLWVALNRNMEEILKRVTAVTFFRRPTLRYVPTNPMYNTAPNSTEPSHAAKLVWLNSQSITLMLPENT